MLRSRRMCVRRVHFLPVSEFVQIKRRFSQEKRLFCSLAQVAAVREIPAMKRKKGRARRFCVYFFKKVAKNVRIRLPYRSFSHKIEL